MADDPTTIMGAVDKMLFGPTAQSEETVSTRGRTISVFSSETAQSVTGAMLDAARGRLLQILGGTPAGQEAQRQYLRDKAALFTGSPWTWGVILVVILLLTGAAFRR